MKKHLLPLTAILLCAFTLGFFLGRTQAPKSMEVTILPSQPLHDLPSELGTIPTSAEYEIVFPIDLNTADIRTLTALPGIGEGLARRIMDYRAYYGPFSSPEELLNVDGIGPQTLEAILELVITGG